MRQCIFLVINLSNKKMSNIPMFNKHTKRFQVTGPNKNLAEEIPYNYNPDNDLLENLGMLQKSEISGTQSYEIV